ncbi:basic amino acid ABC transporter substrate-binding protein [Nocardioides phosphati]|uniref:Basic amino acid ABC transporter substrate-binding protein n=1 Tax=Nocardioides phosphati TaxID=1867775 RepID=A0ABQ2NEE7_9ACTN|nr:ABC transporter substrate-binding protein [Nocardioides phosphati]GGO93416.1 basic amino acid ABC transporter substrate-binding protein [Nocardioides phosphati]
MKNTRLARVASTLSLAVALTGLAACGSSSDDSAKGGLDLIKAGTLTVCSDVPYPPFEDFDKSTPSGFTGYDIDIVSAIAKELKLKLVVKDSDFSALKSGLALNSGQCDVAASAMSITPEREKRLGFSDGYYDSEQSLLVPTGSPIKAIGDLDGKKVAVQKGTTGEEYTAKHAPGAKAISFPSDGQMYAAIKAGQVDAILQDLPVNLDHQKDPKAPGKYTVVETYKTDEQYGFAMKKTNTALIDAVDKALKDLHDNGDFQKIYDTYFATK